jgi:hypothetical protein
MQPPSSNTPQLFNAAQRKPRHPSLLRTDIATAVLKELTLLQAKGLLVQALDELQRIDADEADPQQAELFHHAFVQILHTAQVLHSTVAEPVLEHMAQALRLHHTQHDRVAHALVSAWTCVPPQDSTRLVLGLLGTLLTEARPLPFWVSHLLQLMPPPTGLTGATDGTRQARDLLQHRLDELAPARLAKALRRLDTAPDLAGMQQIVSDLGLLALPCSPSAEVEQREETPPDDDETLVWLSHQHPHLVCVGDQLCDDHWLVSPLGHSTLEHLLLLCARLEAVHARRLRHQLLYQFTHAARLALVHPARRHACLALPLMQRIVLAMHEAGDTAGVNAIDPWVDVLHWLAPHRSGHRAHPSCTSARAAVVDILLLASHQHHPLLALRTLHDAAIDTPLWLPCLVRHSMAQPMGLTRLVHQLGRVHVTRAIHHQLANEVMHQSPPDHLPSFGLELALTVFHEPLAPRGLSRDRLHALSRAQARFDSGWVSFCLLQRFMELTDRFGCVGLDRHDGDWLHAFALEHCQHQARHFAPKPMIEALEGLYDVLVGLGLDADQVSDSCTLLLGHAPPA